MPACPGVPLLAAVPVNTTMSPGWASGRVTGRPTLMSSAVECGTATPKRANVYMINPEQSNPVSGEVPAYKYGVPRCASPNAATLSARAAGPLSNATARAGVVSTAATGRDGAMVVGADRRGSSTAMAAAKAAKINHTTRIQEINFKRLARVRPLGFANGPTGR